MAEILGIIAEYDPFHLGHEYHLKEALKKTGADLTIAVISGYFTQRGEPAIVDKWARAEMALRGGADLVCELPFVFACNNAGYFARGGVEILEALGATSISFGSETADVEALLEAAKRRSDLGPDDQNRIKELVKEGLSYPRALTQILGETDNYGPNDTLGIEYIRHMNNAHPVPVLRKGAGHGEILDEESMASATHIRNLLLDLGTVSPIKDMVPETTLDILLRERAKGSYGDPDMMLPYIQAEAALRDVNYLNSIYGAEEGLGSKLKQNFRYADSREKIIDSLKSKRYTRTRIQRVLIHTLLGLRSQDVKNAGNYIRILGFSEKGAEHLKTLKRDDSLGLPVIENIKRDLSQNPGLRSTFSFDIKAADIYNTIYGRDLYSNSEYVKKPLKFITE